ncbi:MAG: DUF1565 domain-containing protein, partial [Ferruginibacter sp.]
MTTLKIILIIICLQAACSVFCNEYHVSLQGNDNYNGSQKFPFKSIFKATQTAMPGDTVTIAGGEYQLQNQFKPLRSGTPSQWILYRAAPNELVIFDGSLVKKGIQKSDTVNFSRLTEGLFQIEKVNYLRFENIEVSNSNAAGFIIRCPECSKIDLIGCRSNHSHNSGIGVWYSDSVRVLNCEIT